MKIEEKKFLDSKKQKEINREFSSRIETIRKNSYFFRQLKQFIEINSSDENLMYYIEEIDKRGIDVYSRMIRDKFNWSKSTTSDTLNRLEDAGLIEKKTRCPNCGTDYTRIPEICKSENCSQILIRQQGLNNGNPNYPHFLIKITEKGKKYISKRLEDHRNFLLLFEIRLQNIH